MDDDVDSAAALGRWIRQRRGRVSQEMLGRKTGFHRTRISKAESGDLPSADLCAALDEHWRTNGELTAWRARLEAVGGETREDTTDRRQVFELTAAGMVAAETYRELTATGPDVLTLDEIDDAINAHAAAFTVEPHHQLAPKVWKTWESAHALLRGGGGRARSQVQLTVAAGYASYMLCRLAFNLGDTVTSRRFVRLAGDHAEQTNDLVLAASVGGMVSTLAFYGLRYREAAIAAQRTAALADDEYTRARTAAYEARALAAVGDTGGARAALTRMRTSMTDLPLQPGCSPFTPATAAMFEAGILARIGAGVEAEPIARQAVADFDSGRATGYEDHGNALLALSWSLINRERPVVDESAIIAGRVVEMLNTKPTASVTARTVEVAAAFNDHSVVEPVRDFWDRWTARPRLALTAAQA